MPDCRFRYYLAQGFECWFLFVFVYLIWCSDTTPGLFCLPSAPQLSVLVTDSCTCWKLDTPSLVQLSNAELPACPPHLSHTHGRQNWLWCVGSLMKKFERLVSCQARFSCNWQLAAMSGFLICYLDQKQLWNVPTAICCNSQRMWTWWGTSVSEFLTKIHLPYRCNGREGELLGGWRLVPHHICLACDGQQMAVNRFQSCFPAQ